MSSDAAVQQSNEKHKKKHVGHKEKQRRLAQEARADGKEGGTKSKSSIAAKRAFGVAKLGKAKRLAQRKADLTHQKDVAPAVDKRSHGEPPLIAVVGPRSAGKTTLVKSLAKLHARVNVSEVLGPLTVIAGKTKRYTLLECPDDLESLIDVGKVADVALLVIDASFGFEAATFEFLSILQTHGFPKVAAVLTHLDGERNTKTLQKAKKALKHRFWRDAYAGAKTFFISGLLKSGKYPKNDMRNLSLWLSRQKFRPITWRTDHPYLLVDKVDDDDDSGGGGGVYGYLRGSTLKLDQTVHVPGIGDVTPLDVRVEMDPLPLADRTKGETLNRRSLAYGPLCGQYGDVPAGAAAPPQFSSSSSLSTTTTRMASHHPPMRDAAKEEEEEEPETPFFATLQQQQRRGLYYSPEDDEDDEFFGSRSSSPGARRERDDAEERAAQSRRDFEEKVVEDLRKRRRERAETDLALTVYGDDEADGGAANADEDDDDDEAFFVEAGKAFTKKAAEEDGDDDDDDDVRPWNTLAEIDEAALRKRFCLPGGSSWSDDDDDDHDEEEEDFDDDEEVEEEEAEEDARAKNAAAKAAAMEGRGDLSGEEKDKDDDKDDDQDVTGNLLTRTKAEQAARRSRREREFGAAPKAEIGGVANGNYVRVDVGSSTAALIRGFAAKGRPALVGGLLEHEVGTEGHTRPMAICRVRRHRWHPKILKSRDPVILSCGWRRFQTAPIYATEERDGKMRFLKYTPEHAHCIAAFRGPPGLIAPNTPLIGFHSGRRAHPFRGSLTGVVLSSAATSPVVKKLKLQGFPSKVERNTALIRGMFSSSLEAAKFEGAALKTVAGVRGAVKRAVAPTTRADGDLGGTFRATFEDKILLSDIVVCRLWVPVEPPDFYLPLLGGPVAAADDAVSPPPPPNNNNNAQDPSASQLSSSELSSPAPELAPTLARTTAEVRREERVPIPVQPDSVYSTADVGRRGPRKFAPHVVPKKLVDRLPFASKPKELPKRKHTSYHATRNRPGTLAAPPKDPKAKAHSSMLQALNTIDRARQTQRKATRSLKSTKRAKVLHKKHHDTVLPALKAKAKRAYAQIGQDQARKRAKYADGSSLVAS